MTILKVVLLCLFIAAACQSLHSAQPRPDTTGGSVTLQPPDSSIARAVLPLMRAWREAVLQQDRATLLRVALPEYREGIAEALDNEQSRLWLTLFGSRGSYQAFLQDSSISIVIFEHHLLVGSHNSAIGCFAKTQVEWPTTYVSLQELVKRYPVRCLDWGFTEGEENEWFVSYGFGMPERVPRR